MRATWTDSRLEEFATKVDQRFDEVDTRFDEVGKRLDRMDRRFEQVDGRFAMVDSRFEEVCRRLDKIDVDIRGMRAELAANSRSMLQFCGVMVAAQMATVTTLIATQA